MDWEQAFIFFILMGFCVYVVSMLHQMGRAINGITQALERAEELLDQIDGQLNTTKHPTEY